MTRKLLLVQEGMFFGSTDYDDYCFREPGETTLLTLRAVIGDAGGDLEY